LQRYEFLFQIGLQVCLAKIQLFSFMANKMAGKNEDSATEEWKRTPEKWPNKGEYLVPVE